VVGVELPVERQELDRRPVSVSYLINRLQPLPFKTPLMVSLNPQREPKAESVIAEFDYEHPIFDGPAIAAQRELPAISGKRGVWFCGAWNGYGFHEDGLKSALQVANGWDVTRRGRARSGELRRRPLSGGWRNSPHERDAGSPLLRTGHAPPPAAGQQSLRLSGVFLPVAALRGRQLGERAVLGQSLEPVQLPLRRPRRP
jgi:hypothetical protein